MEIMNFYEIPLMEIGNDLGIAGMLYKSHKGAKNPLILLPGESIDLDKIVAVLPSKADWDKLLRQSDINEVEGVRDNEKVILRKSQRNIDTKIMWKVFRRDNYKCRYCAIDFVPLTVDHIITWETGGATHEDNLLSSCSKCNKTRGNMDYKSWLQTEYYRKKLQYLEESVILKNEEISHRLDSLPRIQSKRSR